MKHFIARMAVGLVVAVLLVLLAIGALLFSDAPVLDIVREVGRVFGYWWRGDRRRVLATDGTRIKHR